MELGVGDRHPAPVSHHVLGGEGKDVAGLQGDGLGVKAPDADFGALGVQNGGHGPAHGVPDGLEHIQPLQMLPVAAVGEVEPGRVHAGADEGADHVLTVHRGAQGADDLCFSHCDYLLRVSYCIPCVRPYVTGKKPRWIEQISIKMKAARIKKCAVPPRETAHFTEH